MLHYASNLPVPEFMLKLHSIHTARAEEILIGQCVSEPNAPCVSKNTFKM